MASLPSTASQKRVHKRKDTEVVSSPDAQRPKKKPVTSSVYDTVDGKLKRTKIKIIKKHSKNIQTLSNLFGADADKIQNLINSKDSENAIEHAQKSLFNMLIRLIPTAEQQYLEYKNERAAYALNALVSQTRELISDIQSTKDRSQVADTIIMSIIQPIMTTLAQFLIDNSRYLRKDLLEIVDAREIKNLNEALDRNIKNIGSYLPQLVAQLEERINKTLSD